MKTATTRNASAVIANREDFKTSGALKGGWELPSRFPWEGRLPREYAEAFSNLHREMRENHPNTPIYIVWSYATPIAWYTDKHGWVIPPAKYSITTTKHQGNLPRI
jgi:hypothetical protein